MILFSHNHKKCLNAEIESLYFFEHYLAIPALIIQTLKLQHLQRQIFLRFLKHFLFFLKKEQLLDNIYLKKFRKEFLHISIIL